MADNGNAGRLMIRMDTRELELFCEERGYVVSAYVRGCLKASMRLERQQEKWRRERAAADRLLLDIQHQEVVVAARTLVSVSAVRTREAQADADGNNATV